MIIYSIHNNISFLTLLKKAYEENFIVTVKDRQKIGTTENEDGKQPKSSFKVGSVNYESCYDTKSKKGNSTGRNNIYFCNQGVDGGETIPAEELYSFDFSNYTIHPAKNLKGSRLNGSFRVYNGNTYSFSDGIINGEKLTLAQSKNICDSLQEECHGFVISIPNKLNPNNSNTIFISKKEVGWEDPNTYVKNQKYDDTNTNIISYVKKDISSTKKNIPQDKINQISNKYINQKQKRNITPIPNNTSNIVGNRGQFQKKRKKNIFNKYFRK